MPTKIPRLTHTLVHNKRTDRWTCKCGYALGDGHKKLYARCPRYQAAYTENNIGPRTNEAKPFKNDKRRPRYSTRRISPPSDDLFGS